MSGLEGGLAGVNHEPEKLENLNPFDRKHSSTVQYTIYCTVACHCYSLFKPSTYFLTMVAVTALALQQQWQQSVPYQQQQPYEGSLTAAANEFLESSESLPERLEQLCEILDQMVSPHSMNVVSYVWYTFCNALIFIIVNNLLK